MVPIYITLSRILKEQGRTQTWVIQKMNEFNPELKMDASKFSMMVAGNRKMSADEMIAFCEVLDVSPDEFVYPSRGEGNESVRS